MKPYQIIVILVVVGLIGRAGYVLFYKMEKLGQEKTRFAKNTRYEFSARVDTVIMRDNAKVGIGTVLCTLTAGRMSRTVEDSLRRNLQEHHKLWFNTSSQQGKVRFITPLGGECRRGDSITVSAASDQITVFREGKEMTKIGFSQTLEGRIALGL